MPYIGNTTTSFNVGTANINNGAVTGEKLSTPFDYDSGTLYLDDTNNRVGIGTTSPVSSLHIAGANPQVRVQDTDGTNQTGIFYKNGAATIFYSQDGTSNGSFQWIQNNGTTSTTSLVLNSAGQLGLGTSNPVVNLHIRATGTPILRIQDDDGTNQYSDFYNSAGQSVYNAVNGAGVSGAHIFLQAGNESARIDSSGRLLVGTSASVNVAGDAAVLQAAHVSGFSASLSRYFSAGAAGPILSFAKSRGALNVQTAVQNGDNLGRIYFTGSNGTDFSNIAAEIKSEVDGDPFTSGDTTDLPGRLVFSTTADGASTVTERMRLDSSGRLGLGTSSPGALLDLAANNTGLTSPLSANNRLRFTDTDTTQTNDQPTGTIEWYTSDIDSPGVHAYISTDMFNNGSGALVVGTGFGGSAAERLRITETGLVGIGTTAPSELLSLNSSPSNAAVSIRTGGASFNSVVKFNADDTNYAGIGLENTALVMRCSNSSTPTERARIDSSGRLLIGTSTASGSALLQVAGDAQVQSLNGGPLGGARNRIINGDMRIDQRNAGASVTPTSNATYTVDRWKAWLNVASKFSVQQTTSAPSGHTNSIGITSLSAYTIGSGEFTAIGQSVEGFNVADLGWGAAGAVSVTVSFWVRSSLTGTFGGSVTNEAGNRSYPFTYVINAANTWEQKSVVIPGDTTGTWRKDNGAGLQLFFGIGNGSSWSGTAGSWSGSYFLSATGATSILGTNGATFYITGVQLEAGTVATPFERRSYGQELYLCQRYFETNYPTGYAVGSNSGIDGCWLSVSLNGSDFYDFGRLTFVAPKRAVPTLNGYNPTSGAITFYDYNIATANGNIGIRLLGQHGAALYAATAFTANHAYLIRYTASAEL